MSEIEQKLSTLETCTIQDVSSKFQRKNKLIDECDQLYDQNEATAKEIETQLTETHKNVGCTC